MIDIHDQAYLYAVGALPFDEADEFDGHLAGCGRCADEIAVLGDVAAELAAPVAADPPAQLRGAILSAIQQTPQDTAAPAAVSSPSESRRLRAVAPLASPEVSGSTPAVVPLQRGRSFRAPALLAAAAVLAALAFGGWAWQGKHSATRSAYEASQVAQDARTQATQLAEVLGAPDVKLVTGRVVSSAGSGTVVLSASSRKAVLVTANLPELPEGKVYEAWTIDKRPVPAGTFASEQHETVLSLPDAVFEAENVSITVEPAGGSKTPTTDPLLTVGLPHQS